MLDNKTIQSAVYTGQWVELPFFQGYLYAACKPQENNQVYGFIYLSILSNN